MEIKAVTKFNIGTIVQIRGTTSRFSIGKIFVEVCPGGVQIIYKGLTLAPKPYSLSKDLGYTAEKEFVINEVFLEEIPKVKELEG